MEQKEPETEAKNGCGTLPDGTIAADLPEEPADSAAEENAEVQDEAEIPADPEAVADSPEVAADPEVVAGSPEVAADLPEPSEPEAPDDSETIQEKEAPDDSSGLTEDPDSDVQIEHGYCDICEKEVDFRIDGEFLRDHFLCTGCKSLPRQRAFLHALKMCCPNWRTACMHESSPGGPSSDFLFRNAKHYSISQYYPDLPSGYMGPEGAICEDLENMSYPDNVFDVFITQDVMEHIFDVPAAFNEIMRVLRPGGFYLFTVPYYKDLPKSFCRARRLEDGSVRLYSKAVYHGNPVDDKGALVTWDYGRDFPELVYRMCGIYPVILQLEARYFGLDGEMMEVFMMRKPPRKTDPLYSLPPAFFFTGIPSEWQPFLTPFEDLSQKKAAEEEKPAAQEESATQEESASEGESAAEESACTGEPASEEAPAPVEDAPAPSEGSVAEEEPSEETPASVMGETSEEATVPAEEEPAEESEPVSGDSAEDSASESADEASLPKP